MRIAMMLDKHLLGFEQLPEQSKKSSLSPSHNPDRFSGILSKDRIPTPLPARVEKSCL